MFYLLFIFIFIFFFFFINFFQINIYIPLSHDHKSIKSFVNPGIFKFLAI